MFRLTLCDSHASPLSIALSATPVYLGRAPGNDLVIAAPTVSSRHAAVYTAGGRVFVEDLGSRNGTRVGDRRIRKRAEVRPGEIVELGGTVRLRLETSGHAPDAGPGLFLEQVDGLLRFPVRSRLRIGPPGADVALPELQREVVLEVGADGARVDGAEIALDTPFLLGSRWFRLVRTASSASSTRESDEDAPRYSLKVELDGPFGPRAVVRDEEGARELVVLAENRVALLFVLGRRLAQDQAAGVELGACGWCPDPEVAAGVWGRGGADRSLNVLVTRIRNDLRRAGLDPWILEKRPGHLRLVVLSAEVST